MFVHLFVTTLNFSREFLERINLNFCAREIEIGNSFEIDFMKVFRCDSISRLGVWEWVSQSESLAYCSVFNHCLMLSHLLDVWSCFYCRIIYAWYSNLHLCCYFAAGLTETFCCQSCIECTESTADESCGAHPPLCHGGSWFLSRCLRCFAWSRFDLLGCWSHHLGQNVKNKS